MTITLIAGYASGVRRELSRAVSNVAGATAEINETAIIVAKNGREIPIVLKNAGEEPFFREGGSYEVFYNNGSKWFIYSRGSNSLYLLIHAGKAAVAGLGILNAIVGVAMIIGLIFSALGVLLMISDSSETELKIGMIAAGLVPLFVYIYIGKKIKSSRNNNFDRLFEIRHSMASEADKQLGLSTSQ